MSYFGYFRNWKGQWHDPRAPLLRAGSGKASRHPRRQKSGPPELVPVTLLPAQDPWTPCIYDARDEGCTPSVHPPAASPPPTPQAVFEVRPCRKTQN